MHFIFIICTFFLNVDTAYGKTKWTHTLSPIHQSQINSQKALDELEFSLSAIHYSTTQNFSESKTLTPLVSSGEYSYSKGALTVAYGLSNLLSVFTDFDFGNVAAENSKSSLSKTSHGDLAFGFRFQLPFNSFPLRLETGIVLPTYSKSTTNEWNQFNKNSTLPMGDGITKYWLGLGTVISFSQDFSAELSTGTLMRTQGFSNQLNSNFSLQYNPKRKFFIKINVLHSTPIQEDAYSTTVNPKERSSTILAGSLAMNSMNPTYIQPSLILGYQFQKFDTSMSIQNEIYGKNYSFGYQYALQLSFRLISDPNPISIQTKIDAPYFVQYDLESKIVKLSLKNKQFLIDKGLNDGIKINQIFFIFKFNSTNENLGPILGKAQVTQVGQTSTKLVILETYNDPEIKEGFVVRRTLD